MITDWYWWRAARLSVPTQHQGCWFESQPYFFPSQPKKVDTEEWSQNVSKQQNPAGFLFGLFHRQIPERMKGKSCRVRWRVWLWQCSPGGLWDSLSEAIPSMGVLIRFITSQISGGACCQTEFSAWPVIRASNEDRTSLSSGRVQMTAWLGSVQQGSWGKETPAQDLACSASAEAVCLGIEWWSEAIRITPSSSITESTITMARKTCAHFNCWWWIDR